ncbi:hypothetical protein ACFLQI_03225 [Candidatus Undinarchaeota archaeon]
MDVNWINKRGMSPLVAVLMLLLALGIFAMVLVFFQGVTEQTIGSASSQVNATLDVINTTL